MLTYQNRNIDQVFYGSRQIAEVWLGNKKIFGTAWKTVLDIDSKNTDYIYLLHDNRILKVDDSSCTVLADDIQDAVCCRYGTPKMYCIRQGALCSLSTSGGTYELDTPEIAWEKLYGAGHCASSLEDSGVDVVIGIRNGKGCIYTKGYIQELGEVVKMHGIQVFIAFLVYYLLPNGTLKGVSTSPYTETDSEDVYSDVKNMITNPRIDTLPLCTAKNNELHALYGNIDHFILNFDSSVTFSDSGSRCIIDGYLYDITLVDDASPVYFVTKKSTETGFTAVTYALALKKGVVYDASDVENLVPFTDAPGNFISLSQSCAMTSDGQIYGLLLKDGVKTFSKLCTEVSNA